MILRSKISKSHLFTHAFRLTLLQRHKTKATKLEPGTGYINMAFAAFKLKFKNY